jgi:hypothetical protein
MNTQPIRIKQDAVDVLDKARELLEEYIDLRTTLEDAYGDLLAAIIDRGSDCNPTKLHEVVRVQKDVEELYWAMRDAS